jgi:ABC-2 type transport system ATP-binding protein
VILKANSLSKSYKTGNTHRMAVSNLSFTLERGEILAFLGPNGAGKTTTIKMIATLIRPDSGTIHINGVDPFRNPHCLRELGAILEGNRNVYWRLTTLENIEYFAGLRGIHRTAARREGLLLLKRFGLYDRQGSLVGQLSRGMQQKLGIIVALLLDEPTLGLDVESARDMTELVKKLAEEGIGVLLSTHQLNLAENIAHNVLILKEGCRVLHCSVSDALRSSSQRSFIVTLSEPVSALQQQQLMSVPAEATGCTVSFSGESETLYTVMEILRPSRVEMVRTLGRSLDDVFMEIAQNDRQIA